mmetsp:Transcript_23532/g.93277  ORF Transcript_23532/g.93277 Transcript_23532/m.93277 type:complete len:342 (-) Transcript_23532:206-1231(-)
MRDVHVGWISSAPLADYRADFERIEASFGGPAVRRAYYHDRREHLLRNVEATGFADGWLEQQYFKLEVYAAVNTSWYLVLDSKNIFVAPITLAALFSHHRVDVVRHFFPDGRSGAGSRSVWYDWYVGAADAMHVAITDEQVGEFKATLTPFIFNAARVRSIFDWLRDDAASTLETLLQSRKPGARFRSTTEFAVYEVFTCCNPRRRGELDPWRELPLREATGNAHRNLLTFNGHYSKATLATYEHRLANETEWNRLLLVGWHKVIPAPGTAPERTLPPDLPGHAAPNATTVVAGLTDDAFFAALTRHLVAMYKKAGVIRDAAEECGFYENCASGAVPCPYS